jgi:hypothetical protein
MTFSLGSIANIWLSWNILPMFHDQYPTEAPPSTIAFGENPLFFITSKRSRQEGVVVDGLLLDLSTVFL